jgi:hypothetical protein
MGSRSKPIFFISLLIAVLVATTGCTKPGVKELRQSRDAVHAATSWQEDGTVLEAGQWTPLFVAKVECPSRRDLMWTVQPPKQEFDSQGRPIVHDVWYDGTWYTSDGKLWETLADAEKKAPGKFAIGCGEGPLRVWDGPLYSDLDEVAQKGEIRPGAKMTENGYDCTWWDLAPTPGAAPRYTVCVNATSHLPQVLRSRENGHEYTYVFSQWNTASVGLPPELVQ